MPYVDFSLLRSRFHIVVVGLAMAMIAACQTHSVDSPNGGDLGIKTEGVVPTAASTNPDTPASGQQLTFSPRILPMSGPEIPNSLRGMYQWAGATPEPPGWPVRDVYYRDVVNWNRLEKSRGAYDFSHIDKGLKEAGKMGGRFGFRIMAFSPGAGENITPAYVPRQSAGPPQWNNPQFLQAWQSLFTALGRKYANDPRMGFIDVGGYGSWGEWHEGDMPGEKITPANARKVITTVVNAFPKTHIVINASSSTYALLGMSVSPRVGLRVDCLGHSTNMLSALSRDPRLDDRWKTAPIHWGILQQSR